MTNYKTTVSKFCINSKRYETLAVVSKNRISNVPKNFFLGGTTHMHTVWRPDLEFNGQY